MKAYRRHDDLKFNTIIPSWRLTYAVLCAQLPNVLFLMVKLVRQFFAEFWPLILLFSVEVFGIVMIVRIIIASIGLYFAQATSPLYH